MNPTEAAAMLAQRKMTHPDVLPSGAAPVASDDYPIGVIEFWNPSGSKRLAEVFPGSSGAWNVNIGGVGGVNSKHANLTAAIDYVRKEIGGGR